MEIFKEPSLFCFYNNVLLTVHYPAHYMLCTIFHNLFI